MGESVLPAALMILVPAVVFALDRRNRRRQAADRQLEEEKERIIDAYGVLLSSPIDRGIDGLAELGLDQLGSDRQIRDVFKRIERRYGRHPLSEYDNDLMRKDLHLFFRELRERNL